MIPEKRLTTETLRHRAEKWEKRPGHILHSEGETRFFDNPLFSRCLCASVVNELRFLG